VHDLGTGAETTLPAGLVTRVIWSDDGDRIAYTGIGGGSGGDSHIGIWRWREGPTVREVPIDRPGFFFTTDFTPDGRVIGFINESGNTKPLPRGPRWVEEPPQDAPDQVRGGTSPRRFVRGMNDSPS
jgi:hypothetical protein